MNNSALTVGERAGFDATSLLFSLGRDKVTFTSCTRRNPGASRAYVRPRMHTHACTCVDIDRNRFRYRDVRLLRAVSPFSVFALLLVLLFVLSSAF